MTRLELLRFLVASFSTLIIPKSNAINSERLYENELILKTIHSSGEQIPAIGMGTWITFNVGSNSRLIENRAKILNSFFGNSGALIDTSPMYGSSEEVLGKCLGITAQQNRVFAATKVWTSSASEGLEQFENSKFLLKMDRIHLYQVHNLINWEEHLKVLYKRKERGEINYIGVTTSHGRRHNELQKIMKNYPLDFVQITYNITHREVERHLLPLAQQKGISVIANRPYDGGSLIKRLQKHSLPSWAADFGFNSWADFLLKFIISHPDITCAIPATSRLEHMQENMQACRGSLPDMQTRERMVKDVETLL